MLARAATVWALALLLCGCGPPQVMLAVQAPATFQEEPGGYETAKVVHVVDGDTADVRITQITPGPGAGHTTPGKVYRVRFLGIDTPESVKPGMPVQCFATAASGATKALIEGAVVRLVKDVEETDQYDRILRYVYLGDEMVNARLVVNGYARLLTYPPNVRHADLFLALERDARSHDRGLWSPETCDGGR